MRRWAVAPLAVEYATTVDVVFQDFARLCAMFTTPLYVLKFAWKSTDTLIPPNTPTWVPDVSQPRIVSVCNCGFDICSGVNQASHYTQQTITFVVG